MLDPPLLAEAVKVMVAWPLPATAETDVGALGVVYGTAVTTFEGAELPTLFCAITSKS